MKCKQCGKKFDANRNCNRRTQVYCSEECRLNYYYDLNRKSKVVVCPICEKKFQQTNGNQKTCSVECGKERNRRSSRLYKRVNNYNIETPSESIPVESICPTCRKKHTIYIYPWQNPRNVARCYCPEHIFQRQIKEHSNFAIHI